VCVRSRNMNRYFLLIACLQLIKTITPVNPLTTWAPLVIIFGITAVKELVDDLGRRRGDNAANTRLYTVVRAGQRQQVRVVVVFAGFPDARPLLPRLVM
jgi:phospholipid-translocating ATPase